MSKHFKILVLLTGISPAFAEKAHPHRGDPRGAHHQRGVKPHKYRATDEAYNSERYPGGPYHGAETVSPYSVDHLPPPVYYYNDYYSENPYVYSDYYGYYDSSNDYFDNVDNYASYVRNPNAYYYVVNPDTYYVKYPDRYYVKSRKVYYVENPNATEEIVRVPESQTCTRCAVPKSEPVYTYRVTVPTSKVQARALLGFRPGVNPSAREVEQAYRDQVSRYGNSVALENARARLLRSRY